MQYKLLKLRTRCYKNYCQKLEKNVYIHKPSNVKDPNGTESKIQGRHCVKFLRGLKRIYESMHYECSQC